MIQPASLTTINHKLSEKSSNQTSDGSTAESFMELLNGIKNETEPQTTNDLAAMMNSMFAQLTEKYNQSTNLVEQETNKDDEQLTRNDLLAIMNSFLASITDSNQPSAPLVDEKAIHLHTESDQQETTNLEKLAKLLTEALTSKDGMQASMPTQKTVEDHLRAIFSLRKNEQLGERDFDFQPQFEGKEVVFQSPSRTGNVPFTAANDLHQTPRVPVNQLFSEVIGLLKNQTSLTKDPDFIEAKFSLTPEKLGDIDVKLSIHKGQVFAHFTTETLHGKEALESQLSLLRSSLHQQGLQVDKIEISLSGQGLQNSFSQQGERSRQDQSQQRFSKKKINPEEFYQSHTIIEDWKHKGTENTINILA